MTRWMRLLGSIKMAAPLLVAIAGVLAWGTIYESRFGTAAVQRFIYHSWWFQSLLAFLALNLALAALERYPWKRHHAPFVMAHIGIILILIGGIIGARFGIEGQLIIPEGQAERVLETPGNVLVVHNPGSGLHQIFPTRFETQAWVHEPNLVLPVRLGPRAIELTVDRYFPDALTDEEIADGGPKENPAVQVRLEHEEQQDDVWLFAREPDRFGTGWGEAHVLFLEPENAQQLAQLLGRATSAVPPHGVVSIRFPHDRAPHDIPVPETLRQPMPIKGTPYTITFKDYFPDFALTSEGLTSRSEQPNNPAVSFTLAGPEGIDAHLLFALHPDFPALHGREHTIRAEVSYRHASAGALPPNAIAIIRQPSGLLAAAMTGSRAERQVVDPLLTGTRYTHPATGYQFTIESYYPKAQVTQRVSNRSDEVHAEFLHVSGREGGGPGAEAWVPLRGTAQLDLGADPILVEFRPARHELPVAIKLLDFRKTDYPGTQMASGFESDVELTDTARGMILMRTIKMNHPLHYRGYSFYQSSYVPGATETTVLSVRNDPGTPCVYAGFLFVIFGVVSMFILRRNATQGAAARPRTGPRRKGRRSP